MSPDEFGTIAILGGTGDQGLGLALRLAAAGCQLVIGSRDKARAETAASEVAKAVPDARVEGRGNPEAAAGSQIVVLSVPFENTVSTIASVRDRLEAGQVVVSMVVPLATAIGDRPTRTVRVQQGSAAELVASLVPEGVEVVGALQNVSAHRLQDLDQDMDCDVVVCGALEPRTRIAELCELIPGLRGVNGGVLSNARIVEDLTALIIGLNIRYKVPGGIGVRFPGIPK
jgi:NADPH-dependent F420 reductase